MSGVEFRRHRLDILGIGLDVLEGGSGRPLLFLHAGEGPDVYGTDYLAELAKTHRVIAPWHPGFGGSDLPADMTSIDDLAYFYLELADHFGLEDAVLAGASFGGWIAVEMAVRSVERFSALALAAPLGFKPGGREDRDFFDFYTIRANDWPDMYFAEPDKYRPDFSKWPVADVVGVTRSRESITLFGWKPYMHNPRIRRWLPRIKVPTAVVWGGADKVISAEGGRRYAAAIPGAEFTVVEGAGHFVHVEQPAAFARAVRQVAGAPARQAKPEGVA